MASAKSPVIFHPDTTYYRCRFALKTAIRLVSEQDKSSSCNFQLDFGPVWSDICEMLRWYEAQSHQVGRLWTTPETHIEVQFASDKALKKFLQSKRKVETAMAEIITKRFKPQDSSATFEASTMLLLVTPNETTNIAELTQVTLANHRNCVSLYVNSKMAELPTKPETTLKTVPEDALTENDLPELMKLLHDVVDWFSLGMFLGIPYAKLQMMESDFSGAQVGRTQRLLSYVLVEWMQNQDDATWSTLVNALSQIGKRPAARRVAQEYGVHVPDESVLDDLSPEKNEKLQQVLEEIKQLIKSKSSDMQLVNIQKAIEEAQQKQQMTLETFGSILKDTISKVKMLLTQKENLEKQILLKEKQLQQQQLREGKGAREIEALETAASALKQEVSELTQQLLETDQQLNTARVQHSDELLKKSEEISTLSKQTHQLMREKNELVADLGSEIRSLETSLSQSHANLQLNLHMQQQQFMSQMLQQKERHKRQVVALQEELQQQQKQDAQHSRSPEALEWLEQLSDSALKQLASLSEIGAESKEEGKEYKVFTAHHYMPGKDPKLNTMTAVTPAPDQLDQEAPSNDELEHFGLGKGIDRDGDVNPWNNRILQCRQVRPKNAAVNEDGGKLDCVTSVQSSSSMRGKASVGASVPEAFTKVRVAFDLTRDRTKSQRVEIHCRMQNEYYFIGDQCMPGEKSAFEGLLQEYKEENESTFGDHWCEEFLKDHNNITHYVSSITLGAMTYTVLEVAGGELQKAALDLTHGAVGSLKGETLGVVHYECKPLTNLVSDPTLQEALKTAILQYEERKDTAYYICYPTTSGPRLYWTLREDTICLTEDKKKASRFDVQYTSPAEPPYFYITARTDPDSHTSDPVISILKSTFGSKVELRTKLSEAKPKKILFEFRNSMDPDVTFQLGTHSKTPMLPHNMYACIKPKEGDKFLVARRTDFSSQLHLMSAKESYKKPTSGKYFSVIGIEPVNG